MKLSVGGGFLQPEYLTAVVVGDTAQYHGAPAARNRVFACEEMEGSGWEFVYIHDKHRVGGEKPGDVVLLEWTWDDRANCKLWFVSMIVGKMPGFPARGKGENSFQHQNKVRKAFLRWKKNGK